MTNISEASLLNKFKWRNTKCNWEYNHQNIKNEVIWVGIDFVEESIEEDERYDDSKPNSKSQDSNLVEANSQDSKNDSNDSGDDKSHINLPSFVLGLDNEFSEKDLKIRD